MQTDQTRLEQCQVALKAIQARSNDEFIRELARKTLYTTQPMVSVIWAEPQQDDEKCTI